MDNQNTINKGDIFMLKEKFRAEYPQDHFNHPFIYMDECNGVMLTTSPNYGNECMKEEHFKPGFKIKYIDTPKKQSHFVVHKLIKDVKYEYFDKVGELTEEGIKYIEENIGDKLCDTWDAIKDKTL